MITVKNLLGISQENFGWAAVQAGNVICGALAKYNGGLQAHYHADTHKITVLNSSDLPFSVLQQILYATPFDYQYEGLYPLVRQERNLENNLVIDLTSLRSENLLKLPEKDWGIAGIHSGDVLQRTLMKYNKDFEQALELNYNSLRGKIRLLKSSELSNSDLDKIIRQSPYFHQYDIMSPKVKRTRDPEGNLEIDFIFVGTVF